MNESKKEAKKEKNDYAGTIWQSVYEISGTLNLIREDLKSYHNNVITLLGVILLLLGFILYYIAK